MKKLTVTIDCKPPTAADADALVPLLRAIDAVYMAFFLGIDDFPGPAGVFKHLVIRSEFNESVASCGRMNAFITFRNAGPWADISFSKGKQGVERLTICFQVATGEFLVVAQ